MPNNLTITNWMTETPGLLNKQLKDIVVPGTHHSESSTLSTAISPCKTLGNGGLEFLVDYLSGLLFSIPGIIIRNLGICQNTTVLSQLMSGVRYLDFRVCYEPVSGVYHTQHTVLGAPTADGLSQIKEFLDRAKSELVFLEISYDGGNDDDLIQLIHQYLGSYLAPRVDNTDLKNLKYGDLVGYNNGDNIGCSKVVVLYPNDKYKDYDYLWSMGSSVKDIYDGFTNVDDLDNYLTNQLSSLNSQDGLVKLQYVLEFQFGQNPFQTQEHYERHLPAGLLHFLEGSPKNVNSINILFVDFFEKQNEILVPYIIARNGGETKFTEPDENSGGLYYEKTYQITSLVNPAGGLYCITQYEGSFHNINFDAYKLTPADPLNSKQHWRLRKNILFGGACLFNDATQQFMAITDCRNGNEHTVLGSPTRSNDTGLNIVTTDDGSYVVRAFLNTDTNLESNGNNGGNNCLVDSWGWTPHQNDGLNQKWQITEVSQHLQVPTMGIKIGTLYAITFGDFAITCDQNGAIYMDNFDQNNPKPNQFWTIQANEVGYSLFNPKNAWFWSASPNFISGAKNQSPEQGFIVSVSTDLSAGYFTCSLGSVVASPSEGSSINIQPFNSRQIGTAFKLVPISLQPTT